MIRAGDLTQFGQLKAGHLAPFDSDLARTVRLTFNAPQRTVINVVPMHPDGTFPDEEPFFLAVVDGLEEVEFYALGSFALQAEADMVWFKTVDGQKVSTVIPDAETFTRISERRVRNPEVEALQHMLLQNEQRRMAPLYNELNAMRREREELHAEREAFNQGKSAPGSDQKQPEPAPGAGQPAGGVTPPSGGKDGG